MSYDKPSHRLRTLASRAAVIVAFGLAAPATASAVVQPQQASGDLSNFSQTNASTGSLALVPGGYGSSNAIEATYTGGGNNGYARGIFNVAWQQGDDVWYGAAYYLPTGFRAAMQGQVALLRWDNYPTHPNNADHGGVVINGGDKHAHLMRDQLTTGTQTDLGDSFDLPEGRWFWLEVHQRLAADSSAHNEVYLDGQQVSTSADPNMYAGRSIDRIRFGLVAIGSGAQTNPLSLRFDHATVSTSQVGPLAGMTPAAPSRPPVATTPSSARPPTTSTGTLAPTVTRPTTRRRHRARAAAHRRKHAHGARCVIRHHHRPHQHRCA